MTKVELIKDILQLDSSNDECILWAFDKRRLEQIRFKLIKNLKKFDIVKDLKELEIEIDDIFCRVVKQGIVKYYQFGNYELKVFAFTNSNSNVYYLEKYVYNEFLEEDKVIYLYEGKNKQECLEILKKEKEEFEK